MTWSADANARPAEKVALQAAITFVCTHGHADMQRFSANVVNWGDSYRRVCPTRLPAADNVRAAVADNADLDNLLQAFVALGDLARWEQSYKASDGVVGDDMLSTYGFVELVGKLGPFVSHRIRLGVGTWGVNVTYPPHQHSAEEIYVVLAGNARFHLHGEEPAQKAAGDLIYVEPSRIHGLSTGDEPVVVFYLWQSGDLRETSKFAVTEN